MDWLQRLIVQWHSNFCSTGSQFCSDFSLVGSQQAPSISLSSHPPTSEANWPIGIHWPIGSSLLYHSTHRLVRDTNACLAFLSRTSLMLRSEAMLRCCSTASRYRDAAPCSGIPPTKLPRFHPWRIRCHIHGVKVARCKSLRCLKAVPRSLAPIKRSHLRRKSTVHFNKQPFRLGTGGAGVLGVGTGDWGLIHGDVLQWTNNHLGTSDPNPRAQATP